MDMKKIYFILVMSVFSLTSCITTKPVQFGELDAKELERAKPYVWRELLKEYFLCVCITEGFKDKNIDDDDISGTVYFDVLPYSPEAFQEIKAYASSFVETIEPSPIMDHGGKRTVHAQIKESRIVVSCELQRRTSSIWQRGYNCINELVISC